jgi:hypothetical protein
VAIFGEAVDDDEDDVRAIRERQTFNKIHRDVLLCARRYWQVEVGQPGVWLCAWRAGKPCTGGQILQQLASCRARRRGA